jgi:hypothetical protein
VAADPYHGAVTNERGRHGADQESLALLAAAKRFRDAASSADRPDVVAHIDEAILLLADTGDSASRRTSSDDKANVVLRILNGLGL